MNIKNNICTFKRKINEKNLGIQERNEKNLPMMTCSVGKSIFNKQ